MNKTHSTYTYLEGAVDGVEAEEAHVPQGGGQREFRPGGSQSQLLRYGDGAGQALVGSSGTYCCSITRNKKRMSGRREQTERKNIKI